MSSFRDNIEEGKKLQTIFAKTQAEKNFYLGEYKERVLGALTKEQLVKDGAYEEIFYLMEQPEAYLLKLSRDVGLKNLKPYINYAEKIGLKNQLVDGLNYKGEVGLVIVSKEAVINQREELIIRDMDQDFIDAGLGQIVSKSRGSRICSKHYHKIEELLPNYVNDFKKIGVLGKLLGHTCPICEEEKHSNRRK